jgi:hypothetical protein
MSSVSPTSHGAAETASAQLFKADQLDPRIPDQAQRRHENSIASHDANAARLVVKKVS